MATVNFPKSFDMASKQPPVPCSSFISRFRSDNSTYTTNSSGSVDTIRIQIPCGGRGQYLMPNDSFITFKMTPTIASLTAGTVKIDSCAYSLFRRCRVLHGSTVLIDINNCGRLWNALRDVQVPASARVRDEVCLLADADSAAGTNANNYLAGVSLTSGQVYDAAFVLPVGLLGSLSKNAVPLCLMGGSDLFLELELNPANVAETTRVFATPDGAVGVATTANHTLSIALSDIYYSAKIVEIPDPYQSILLQAYSTMPVMLPAIDYVADMKVIASGSSVINEKLAISRSSCNAIFWWFSNSNVANGVINNYNYNDGVTHRQGCALDTYTVQVSGNNLLEVRSGVGATGYFLGSQPLLQLQRVFNQSVQDGLGVLGLSVYCNATDTYASASAVTKRFVGSYSLEKYDADSGFQSGMNLIGQDVRLVVNLTSATTESQNLYVFGMSDVLYEIREGLAYVRA